VTPDLALDRVTKRYGDVLAVDDVSFEVRPESFFSLLGPSGCGKTTILRLIAGFLSPDQGRLQIRGEVVNRKPPYRRDTAMVFQNYALFPHMSVAENVGFGLGYRGVERKERAARVGEALEQVRLTGMDRRYPAQLSGGQQQRVALARAIVTRPALLLLDEPLSNLDLRLRQEMRHELRRIQTDVRITTIYVTHDQAEAFSMSDNIAVLKAGKLIQVGPPDEIFLRPKDEFVVRFIGETNRFPGIAVELKDGTAAFKVAGDAVIRVAKPEGSVAVGSSQLVVFREEQVHLGGASTSVNAFHGRIADLQNLGSMLTYTVAVGEALRIRATVPAIASNRFQPGDEVFAEVEPSDCITLPLPTA